MYQCKDMMLKAVEKDLGARETLGDMIHWNGAFLEIDHVLKNFEKWSNPKKVELGLICGPGYNS